MPYQAPEYSRHYCSFLPISLKALLVALATLCLVSGLFSCAVAQYLHMRVGVLRQRGEGLMRNLRKRRSPK